MRENGRQKVVRGYTSVWLSDWSVQKTGIISIHRVHPQTMGNSFEISSFPAGGSGPVGDKRPWETGQESVLRLRTHESRASAD